MTGRLAQNIEALLSGLSPTARDDLIAVSLLDLISWTPDLQIPPALDAVLAGFLARAELAGLDDPRAIWASVDAYLSKAPLDGEVIVAIQRALREAWLGGARPEPQLERAAITALFDRGPPPANAVAADPLARFRLSQEAPHEQHSTQGRPRRHAPRRRARHLP